MYELVSILVPAYNAEPWMAATIRSALAQTWPRTEVIVVDDGSRDGTLAVAKAFESASVKVISQPNMGAPAARNTALSAAQGTYIQWLDADDLLDTGKISAQMRVANEVSGRRVLLSCPFGRFYYRPERAVFTPTPLWRDVTPVEYFLCKCNENAWFQTSAWLISRELTDAVGPWDGHDSPDDDGDYFSRAVMTSAGVKFVSDARTYYRVGNYGSLNNARSRRAMCALFDSKVKCLRCMLSLEDSERTRAASVRVLQDWLPYFYPEHGDLIAEARRLAIELGGELHRPSIKWKYRPVQWLLGYDRAIVASRALPRARAQTLRRLETLLWRLSSVLSRNTSTARQASTID